MVDAKFLEFEENNDEALKEKGFLGILTFSLENGSQIHSYRVQKNKDGGFFVVPFSMKINDSWRDSFLLDSHYAHKNLKDNLRQMVKDYFDSKESKEVPF